MIADMNELNEDYKKSIRTVCEAAGRTDMTDTMLKLFDNYLDGTAKLEAFGNIGKTAATAALSGVMGLGLGTHMKSADDFKKDENFTKSHEYACGLTGDESKHVNYGPESDQNRTDNLYAYKLGGRLVSLSDNDVAVNLGNDLIALSDKIATGDYDQRDIEKRSALTDQAEKLLTSSETGVCADGVPAQM